MSLFDKLVDEALNIQSEFTALRMTVEKELLHHDILRIFSEAGFLKDLVFMGGPCLRACYGSQRLSEGLDFTGGRDFKRDRLSNIATVLVDQLQAKYALPIHVVEPIREMGNVETWKLKIQIRPAHKDKPAQRIHIDICAIPSYQIKPMMLLNLYGVEMGTSGLILRAESREEIFADKLIAFALRPNSIKNRDLWDMVWLHQQGIQLPIDLIPLKLSDHHCDFDRFSVLLNERLALLKDPLIANAFKQEMNRFLPTKIIKTIEQSTFWDFLTQLLQDLSRTTLSQLH